MIRQFRYAFPVAAVILLFLGCAHLAPRRPGIGPVLRKDKVLFRYYAPSARRVQLAGDWPENNWARGDGRRGEANVGLMTDADGDGVWEIEVDLEPGRYKYLFWVDETTWFVDSGNAEEVEGGPARICSLLVVYRHNGKAGIR